MFEKATDLHATDLQLSGLVVNGRVLLDPAASDPVLNTAECAQTVDPADPGGAFVAVNAPFDPQSVQVETEELAEA